MEDEDVNDMSCDPFVAVSHNFMCMNLLHLSDRPGNW